MTMSETKSLQVPDREKLKHVQLLCDISRPYELSARADKLFVTAMKEIVAWHRERNEFFAKLLEMRNFDAEQLDSLASCASIPFVLASFFKAHEQLSIPRDDIAVHLTSSGTTGQKSQIFFDEWTLSSAQRMIDFIFEENAWISKTPANYLLYTYETEADSKLGTAYTDNFLCKYAPVNRVYPALRRTGNGGHEFDIFGCIEKLQDFEREGLPVRIFGFPSFFYFTLERMSTLKMDPIKLHHDSLVFLGGGWKGNADKAIDKLDLYKQVNEQLGIPDLRIRDGFGSVEHCIPYIECDFHQFHVPVWSRVFIRDVKTLAPLPSGERGFLHFVSPYITSVPAASVLMGDLASLHEGSSCPCNLETPYFVIHGRAGVSRNKSCAVAAAELLSKERRQV